MVDFMSSAEKDVAIGAGSAALAMIALPYIPQALSQYTNLIAGVALILLAMYIKHDGIGYAALGAGIILAMDGLVRVVFPQVQGSGYFAPAQLISAKMSGY